MDSKSKYAFYGTLRRGMENYETFRNSMEYLRTVDIPGFRMYSKGSYPYVVRSQDEQDRITAEIFQIGNPMAAKEIDELELGAGYFLDYMSIGNEKFGIYVFQQNFTDDFRIASGDWVQHVKERGF